MADPNVKKIRTVSIPLTAATTGYRLPDVVVPDGMELIIKAWPNNIGLVYVGETQPSVTNIYQVYPLAAGDHIGYKVKNANEIFVSGTVAGDFVALTVEQKEKP